MSDILVRSAGTPVVDGTLGAATTLPASALVGAQGPPGATGATGAKGDPGQGMLKGALATLPGLIAGNDGSLFVATDTGLKPAQRAWALVGSDAYPLRVGVSVIKHGADPSGVVDSAAAIQAAIDEAALLSGFGYLRGGEVLVPPGDYKCDAPIHVRGGVVLRGEGDWRGQRLLFTTPDGQLYIDGANTAPVSIGVGGGRVARLSVRGTRPVFATYSASPASVAVGTNVRRPGDNRGYWACVQAGATAGGTPPAIDFPDLSRPWSASEDVPVGAVRRATGDWAHYFVCRAAGRTGASEPTWNTAATHTGLWYVTTGSTTSDGTAQWECFSAAGYVWQDGTAVWAARCHTGALIQADGHIEHVAVTNFANFAFSILGDVNSLPSTNNNRWTLHHCTASGCGGGYWARGGDANGGSAVGCEAIGIGFEDNGSTYIPGTSTPPDLTGFGGHGFLDESFFGNDWTGCLAETCVGRNYCSIGASNGAAFVGCYGEGGSAPDLYAAWSGAFAGTQGSGIAEGGYGVSLTKAGLSGARVKMAAAFAHAPYGTLSGADAGGPGIYNFGDASHTNWFGTHRGWNGYEPDAWVFGTYPTIPYPLVAWRTFDHATGPSIAFPKGHFCGPTGADFYVCYETATAVAADPRMSWRGGRRAVGDRHEPPEGWTIGGTTYVGRRCRVAGWDGAPVAPSTTYFAATAFVKFPWVVRPTGGNGYVYACTVTGTTGAGGTEPPLGAWPTTVGQSVTWGTATFACVGPDAVWQYYGALV